jgi:hypothetical protein
MQVRQIRHDGDSNRVILAILAVIQNGNNCRNRDRHLLPMTSCRKLYPGEQLNLGRCSGINADEISGKSANQSSIIAVRKLLLLLYLLTTN